MRYHYKVLGEKPVSIVIEIGLGASLSEWIPVSNLLAEKYGVLLYERAGINKSEPSINSRTPLNIAKELYELLKTINHLEEIVIIAHSQGGLYAQQFCRLYPNMVRGIVLLDPLTAKDNIFKELLTDKEYFKSGVDKSSNFKLMYKLSRLKLGFITKMILKKAPPFYYYNDFNKEEEKDILGSADNPIHAKTALEEYNEAHNNENIRSLITEEGFPNIPMVLITHSSSLAIEESMKFGNNTREFASKIEEIWQEIMKEYLNFTTKSTYIEASKSTHYIHLTEPKLIISAVDNIVD